MYKQFEDYEAEERLISLLKNSELRCKYKTRMERRRSNLNKARFLFVVLLLAILFTAAVMEFFLAAPEHNEHAEEKVVENVAEGTAEVTAFKVNMPTLARNSLSPTIVVVLFVVVSGVLVLRTLHTDVKVISSLLTILSPPTLT